MRRVDLKTRFESYVMPALDGCWYWTGAISSKGYGRFSVSGKNRSAHQISYEIYRGDRNSLLVCHHCDNRSCVNPNHLFLVTCRDNTNDMFKKGRNNNPFGERHLSAKLKEHQVLEIRSLKDKLTISQLKEIYNMSGGAIYGIIINKTWKHLL